MEQTVRIRNATSTTSGTTNNYATQEYVDTKVAEKLDKSMIVYSETEPTNPVEGMIWLKPVE